jgi:methylthioribose-1-phosphate isomerase
MTVLSNQVAYLLSSRPTAVNLLDALNRITAAANSAHEAGSSVEIIAKQVIDAAIQVWSEDRARNVKIGDHGAAWIIEKLEREGVIAKGEKINVLTVRTFVPRRLAKMSRR